MTTRRAFLAAAAALPAAACAARLPFGRGEDELAWIDATETARLIRTRRLGADEALQAAIARARRLDPTLHFLVGEPRAWTGPAPSADAPFAGVPILIKDLDDLAGWPTRYGTRLTAFLPPKTESESRTRAFLDAGFVPFGKSATPEYGFLPTTEPLAFPATRNPWNPDRSSGGSSGGAAAATAAGVVPLAHATDGGGSIRIPAAVCGLFGMKPSRGRIRGDQTGASELSVQLAVTRSVRDSAALFAAIEKPAGENPYPLVGAVAPSRGPRLKIGFVTKDVLGRAAEPEIVRAVQDAAALCERLGHTVEEATWPMSGDTFAEDFLALWAYGAHQIAQQAARALGRAPTEAELEPFTLTMARRFAAIGPEGFEAARRRLGAAVMAYRGWHQRHDVILSPVLGQETASIGRLAPDTPYETLVERLSAYAAYTPIQNVAGTPAMSVPLHWTAQGLPVGVQFAADVGREAALYALAYELEEAKPWARRRPPVRHI